MRSQLSLQVAGIVLSYLLQVAAAYLACSLLSRMLVRPSQRFKVWTAFLAGSGVYWAVIVCTSVNAWLRGAAPVETPSLGALLPFSFVLPSGWSEKLLLISGIFVAGYAAALLCLTVVACRRRVRLRLLLRNGRPASAELRHLFEGIRRELGISHCHLMVLPGITSPSTIGWLRPRVFLPTVCEELGATPQLADVLHHELAHVLRRDYFWAGLSGLVCNVLFFHPATWRAKKLMRVERELACDSAVIEARPDHRADYADSLAYFVRLRMIEEQTTVGLDFAASASSLGRRVRFILAAPRSLPWWQRTLRAAVGLAAICAFAAVAPALTVVLGFARTLPTVTQTQNQNQPAPGGRSLHRRTHAAQSASLTAFEEPARRIQAKAAVRETPVYSLTSGNSGGGFEPSEISWRELNRPTNHPTVASVVSSAMAVVLARGPIDHDHDHTTHSTHFSPQ